MNFSDPKIDLLMEDFSRATLRRFRWLDRISGDVKKLEELFAKATVPNLAVSCECPEEPGVRLWVSWSAIRKRIMYRVGVSGEELIEAQPLLDQKALVRAEVQRVGLLPQLLAKATAVMDRESDDAETYVDLPEP